MATETIKYDVLLKEKAIEIRRYDEILLASTRTNMNNPTESGFNKVFGYISGHNESDTKINMTTPVVSFEEENILTTGFYVPSKYNSKTVPKPKGDVFINSIKPSIYAVITFYGAWTKENYNHHNIELLDWIKESNYEIDSHPFIMRYNAPYTPDHLKRNEIAYQISNYK